ncbi:MAG: hypothetical protein K8F91_22935, partial [Candidatus Obscuribacterales bacterium]|nr:hypothetical protein [Candidatus Obscuribacterales bacterium]
FIALSAQYQAALARYNQHRKEFFEHCQKYHSRTPPQPTAKFFAPVSTSEQKPLKVTAEDKCKELVALENTLGENEKTLTSMISNYELATQKESAAVLAGMWSQAEQLALSNQAQALQFNHMCIKKTSQASSKIHDLITSAQRDGAYGEQQKAFQDYSNNNKLQQELFQRANKHGRFALMILSQLQSMRPPGATSQGPDMPGISGGNLEIESRTLSDEYRQLQVMFEKLRAMQKSFGK